MLPAATLAAVTIVVLPVAGAGGGVSAGAPAPGAVNPCGPNRYVRAAPAREEFQASFAARSYAPGSTGILSLYARRRSRPTLQVFRAGVGPARAPGGLRISAVSPPSRLQVDSGSHRLSVQIGRWPSGFYVARIQSRHSAVYAAFVVRPAPSSRTRVAVVLPTDTWAAYNFRDTDGNGYGDTWYADPRVHTIALARPFPGSGLSQKLGRGGFAAWLAGRRQHADFYSDEDLNDVPSGDALAARYDLIVFAGHEEYVTQHVYTIIERYRDLGGNLAFLSSNSFYARVEITHGRMTCLGHFRDFGEPEAGLVGVQYVDWFHDRYRGRPYVVRDVRAAPWFFRGTGLRVGDRFGFSYGIEIDALAPSSPPGLHVLADVPDVFGAGKTAQMTYYRTGNGAKVFAAGTMNFDSPQSSVADRLLQNLWSYLREP